MKTDSEPAISIILLSLLRQEETRRCIKSIHDHTPLPFEIIVVDMGSSEEIATWLRHLSTQHQHLKVIYNKDNVGTTRGRNQGIEAASGQYLVFLDNDAEVTPGWIESLVLRAEASADVGACGSKIISRSGRVICCARFVKALYEDERLSEIGLEFVEDYQQHDPAINHLEEVPWYPTTCLLVKRAALEAAGVFDEKLSLCEEDKDLCLRIRKAKKNILYVPDSVIWHHRRVEAGEYAKIRNNLQVLMADIRYFRQKWDCGVFIRHSRSYLHKSGLRDLEIDRVKKSSPFNTIIEEGLKISELILTVTSRCNHRCGMCYYHEQLNSDQRELSLDEYQQISESLDNLNILWISGGEPFLRDDLAKICRVFVNSNKVKSIFIPTNGSRPDTIVAAVENILEQNPEIRLSLMFSLEGPESTHDAIHGKKGAFASVEKSIKKLIALRVKLFRKKRYFSILLNTVVTTQNQDKVIDLMEYVKTRLMVDSHTFSPMRGQGLDKAHQPPDSKDLAALYEQARAYHDFYARRARQSHEKLQQFRQWLDRRYRLWCDVLDDRGLPFECQAGNLIGVLEPDGSVRLCESTPVVANVRDYDYDFQRAWFSARADQTRESVADCSCTHACFLGVSESI
jgi:GT2 family glycosyltransferase/MoaA/NifB/PqqE/SkfB family radical SAM enzyme